MDNFKFTTLLAATPFSEEERRNFTIIFNTLTDDRKIAIIEWWPKYLDKILTIKQKAKEEREKIIKEWFEKIHRIMNDAYLREQEEQKKKEQARKEQEEIERNAEFYNIQKKLEQIRAMERSAQEKEKKPFDPLADVVINPSETDTIQFPL